MQEPLRPATRSKFPLRRPTGGVSAGGLLLFLKQTRAKNAARGSANSQFAVPAGYFADGTVSGGMRFLLRYFRHQRFKRFFFARSSSLSDFRGARISAMSRSDSDISSSLGTQATNPFRYLGSTSFFRSRSQITKPAPLVKGRLFVSVVSYSSNSPSSANESKEENSYR